MSITVIIPTYKRPDKMLRALRSVQQQTYRDLVIKVYDNASGDSTKSVVIEAAKDDPRIIYYGSEKNVGMLNNFNRALKDVNTPYFAILCDDDVVLPNFIEEAVSELDRCDAIIACGAVLHVKDGKVISAPLDTLGHYGYYAAPSALRALSNNMCIGMQAMLYRREVIEKVGLFATNVGVIFDKDQYYKIAASYPMVIVNKPWALYDAHDESCSVSGGLGIVWPYWKNMIENLGAIPTDCQTLLWDNIKNQLYTVGVCAARDGKFAESEACAKVLDEISPGRARLVRMIGFGFFVAGPVVRVILKAMKAGRAEEIEKYKGCLKYFEVV